MSLNESAECVLLKQQTETVVGFVSVLVAAGDKVILNYKKEIRDMRNKQN